MLQIGKINHLKILRESEYGLFLDGGADGEILLPKRYIPEDFELGDTLEVFICYDSEDRLIATAETPIAMVGEFAVLKVVAMSSVGAFLDWGLPKDLFLPFSEQSRPLHVGDDVVVYLYLDKSNRISASMRLERNLDKTPGDYKEGQAVELLVVGKTDLGYKAIIEGRHIGVLYKNEVFQELNYGQFTQGFIKQVRSDGKIDLSLQKTGQSSLEAADEIAQAILDLLKQKGGFLAVNDKTPAESIYNLFGVSKKKYKIALGGLYKKRLISVTDEGIRLVSPASKP